MQFRTHTQHLTIAPTEIQTDELFLMRLDGQLKMTHPLIKLANTLDWSAVEKEFAGYFVSTRGRPALPPRLVAELNPGSATISYVLILYRVQSISIIGTIY